MPSLHNADCRAAIHRRVDALELGRRGRWGHLDAPRMICHLSDQLRVALGDIGTTVKPGPLRHRVLREILVYRLPWPRGRIQTVPEMLMTHPTAWEADIRVLHELVDRVGQRSTGEEWPPHPGFGPLSGGEWGRLCWKHLDYHLRQFAA